MRMLAYFIGFILFINLLNSIMPAPSSNANRSPSNAEANSASFCVEHQELTKQDCAFNGVSLPYRGDDVVFAPSVSNK